MPRYIDADALIALIDESLFTTESVKALFRTWIKQQPSVKERTGKWEEKEVINIEDSKQIEEWQSCRCSVCGRYDTRPYMYYFDEPHFCSWCGAKMEVTT